MAYWKFDDAGEFDDAGRALPHRTARDSSGQGNDLPLVVMPQPRATTIQQVRLGTSVASWLSAMVERAFGGF